MDMFIKVGIIIIGVILVICPKKVLDYFWERDKENGEVPLDMSQTTYKVSMKKISRIYGGYCVSVGILDICIEQSDWIFIVLYLIIPIIIIIISEKKFKIKKTKGGT